MVKPTRRRRVPQPSRLSQPRALLGENEFCGTQTLADHIASFKGALTAQQLSELLSISAVTVFKIAKRGPLPSFRVGSCVRFCPRTVADWLRTRGGSGHGRLAHSAVHLGDSIREKLSGATSLADCLQRAARVLSSVRGQSRINWTRVYLSGFRDTLSRFESQSPALRQVKLSHFRSSLRSRRAKESPNGVPRSVSERGQAPSPSASEPGTGPSWLIDLDQHLAMLLTGNLLFWSKNGTDQTLRRKSSNLCLPNTVNQKWWASLRWKRLRL